MFSLKKLAKSYAFKIWKKKIGQKISILCTAFQCCMCRHISLIHKFFSIMTATVETV